MPKLSPTNRKAILLPFDKLFVPHAAYQEVLAYLQDEIDESDAFAEVSNLYVTGPSGIGKSTLIANLQELYPRELDARHWTTRDGREMTADHVPLLVATMPTQPTGNSLARELLQQIGDQHYRKGDREQLMDRLEAFTQGCGTRAIVIDEAQRAVDRDGILRRFDLAEWLKDFHERTNVLLILFGMGRVRHLFDHDGQVGRRWDNEIKVPPYEWGKADDGEAEPECRLNFLQLLKTYADNMPVPFAREVDVEDDETALRFLYASRGVSGLLKKLLLRAIRTALRDGKDEIGNAELSHAFRAAFRSRLNAELVDPWGPDWDRQSPPDIQDEADLLLLRRDAKNKSGRKAERKEAARQALSKAR